MLIAITITGMLIANKILITAINMAIIRENILFYNEQEVKTSQMTREVEFFFREREEKFYKSNDPLVRGFANLPGLIKALVVVLIIALVAIIGYIWIYIMVYISRWRKRRRRRRHRRNWIQPHWGLKKAESLQKWFRSSITKTFQNYFKNVTKMIKKTCTKFVIMI